MSLIRRSPTSPQPIAEHPFVIDVSDSPPPKPEGFMSRVPGYTRIRKHSHTEHASMWTSWFCNARFLLLAVCAGAVIYFLVRHYQTLDDPAMTEHADVDDESHWVGLKRMFQRAFGDSGPDHHPPIVAPPPHLGAGIQL